MFNLKFLQALGSGRGSRTHPHCSSHLQVAGPKPLAWQHLRTPPSYAASPQPCGEAGLVQGTAGTPSRSQADTEHHPGEEKLVPTSWARLARAVASGRLTWTTLPPSSIRRRHNSASREPRNCSSSSYCPSRRSVAPGRGSLYTAPPA